MKTLQPINLHIHRDIPYYSCDTEFEVQAELFCELKKRGYDVRGEVCYRNEEMQCRFDLVIFNNKIPRWIIEVKASDIKHRKELEDTRQGRRYRMFGIPSSFIYGRSDFNALFEELSAELR